IDTIIHGYALHSMYGWSMHLVGAVWSSVTHLLLHFGRSPQEERTNGDSKPPSAPLVPPQIHRVNLGPNGEDEKERSEFHIKAPLLHVHVQRPPQIPRGL
ncbi:hypothetical protein ALC57_02076, partial [Trachymyrmex cornetzi]